MRKTKNKLKRKTKNNLKFLNNFFALRFTLYAYFFAFRFLELRKRGI